MPIMPFTMQQLITAYNILIGSTVWASYVQWFLGISLAVMVAHALIGIAERAMGRTSYVSDDYDD